MPIEDVADKRFLVRRAKRSKTIKKFTALALIATCTNAVGMAPAWSSDWVDGDVTEFTVRPPAKPPASRSEYPTHNQPSGSDDGSGTFISPENGPAAAPKHPQDSMYGYSKDRSYYPDRKNEDSEKTRAEPFTPPDDAVIKRVSDPGGAVLGERGRPEAPRAPLEATVSKYTPRVDPLSGSAVGLNQEAFNLLSRAPFLAQPKTESVSTKTFKEWLSATHADVEGKITKDQVIEIKGAWDDSAHALRSFGIPYTRVNAKKFSELNLDKVKVVIINCAGDLPNDAILSLRRFVGMGGYLLSTDWALSGVIQKAFPGFVEWNGGYTHAELVDVVAVVPDPVLYANTPPVAHWKLVKKSQLVKVIRIDKVKVLARSRMLMREDPSQLGVLAFLLEYGLGHVLHLVGHFDNNADLAFNNALEDPAPGIGISFRQALAANFLMQAFKDDQEPVANAR